jgi:hypothetical protein
MQATYTKRSVNLLVRTASTELLSRFQLPAFFAQHRAQLFAECWRVPLSVVMDGVRYGYIEQLFFIAQNRDVARLFG